MTFTASDVSSLAQSLTHWEWAEYVACAFVAIACAGEYIADFTDWFTAGDERRKKRLAKRSTLLLIVSLSVELFCLVQTNSISGQLIGSLSEKATSADTKAQSALDKSGVAESKADAAGVKAGKAEDKSDSALSKAGAAETSLGKAERESKSAETAASSALTLATDAHKEAESFQTEILSAEQKLDILKNRMADRSLTPAQQSDIASRVRKYGPRTFDLLIVGSTGEIKRITDLVLAALAQAQWTVGNDGYSIGGSASGLYVGTMIGSGPEIEHAADDLALALIENGLACSRMAPYERKVPGAVTSVKPWDINNMAQIMIVIGAKP